MLHAGGIHYYLCKQISVVNKYVMLTRVTVNLSNEYFNEQCVGVLFSGLAACE